MKRLSHDKQTGALSAILRYPAGWRAAADALAADEEFFVLDGALDHGCTEYGADCYAFWPRFYPRQAISVPSGATVLAFLSTPAQSPAPFDPAQLTERIDVRQGEWKANLAAMGLEVMAEEQERAFGGSDADPDTGGMALR